MANLKTCIKTLTASGELPDDMGKSLLASYDGFIKEGHAPDRAAQEAIGDMQAELRIELGGIYDQLGIAHGRDELMQDAGPVSESINPNQIDSKQTTPSETQAENVSQEAETGDTKSKEPWQMTLSEYEAKYGKPRKGATSYSENTQHKNAVATAINMGKPVPAEVLSDYPDLQQATAPAAGAEAEAPQTAQAEPEQATEESQKSPIEVHNQLFKSLRDGTATLDEYKAGFDRLVSSEAAIKAELNGMTKAELLKLRVPYWAKNEKKDRIVDAAYRGMMDDFSIGRSISYMMGEKYENVIRAMVDRATKADIDSFASRVKAAREEADTRIDKMLAAVKDPKTLEDFTLHLRSKMADGMDFAQARMTMSPEQRAAYDEMAGEKTRDERRARADQQKTDVRAASQTMTGQVIETKHTKTGEPLFVVKAAERVERDVYNQWNATAKRLGGWYSSFKGAGAVPGFQFKTRENADAFLAYLGGNVEQARETVQARRDAFQDDKNQTAVERLREMADRLEERANDSLGMDRMANTARRARFAASAEAAANADKAMSATMRNIATAIESGKAKFLDRIRQKVQVETLQNYIRRAKNEELRAKYPAYIDYERHQGEAPGAETADYAEFPRYSAYRSDLAKLGRQLSEIDGTKKIGARVLSVADDVTDVYLKFAKENLHKVSTFRTQSGGHAEFASKAMAEAAISRSGYKGKAVVLPFKRGQNIIIQSPSFARENGIWSGDDDKRIALAPELGAEIVEKTKGLRNVDVPWVFSSAYEDRKRLAGIGIETPAEFRALLREFIGLREQPAEEDNIKKMEREMIGRRNDGMDFFPTPAGVVQDMIDAAGIQEGMAILEPSAGMGHIAEGIRKAGVDPDVVEIGNDRRDLLEAKGFLVVGRDFMDMSPRDFTFGDVFRDKDGVEGVMRGSGGLGSNRVGFIVDGAHEWRNRDELTGIKKTGSNSGYDRIIMNPPFSNRRDIEHVRHAYELLKPGGRLVAIMGEGSFYGSDKKATEFREWLENLGGTSEKLDDGVFMDPSLPVNTGAAARMVVIDKPEETRFSRRTGKRTGITLRDAQATVDRMSKGYQNLPPILLHAGPGMLKGTYDGLLADIRAANATGDVEAAFSDGKIHVFLNNLNDTFRLEKVVFEHELTHYGLRGVFGPDLDPILDHLWKSSESIRALAEQKKSAFGLESNVEAVEEVLADLSPDELVKLTGWQKLVMFVRDWLAKHGFNGLADRINAGLERKHGPEEAADMMVADILAKAREFARSGKRGNAAAYVGTTRLSELAPTFYSQLAVAVEGMPDKVNGTSAANVKAWLFSNAAKLGVKSDEIQWSGINEYLDLRGKDKVTKAEIADYLSGNGVRVDTVAKGGARITAEPMTDALWGAVKDMPFTKGMGYFEEDTYLLRIDGKPTGIEYGATPEAAIQTFKKLYAVGGMDYAGPALDASGTKFSGYWEESYKGGIPGTYREILVTLPERAAAKVDTDGQISFNPETNNAQNFRSSHWDEPNVLVHLRLDEVTGADGKRYVRVGEVQSDWGQKGKKEGFYRPGVEPTDEEVRDFFDLRPGANPADYRQEMIDRGWKRGTPAAPFVTDTKAWVALGIKRAMRHAVDVGADGIVFGTGQQNADLYGLSKQIDAIGYEKRGELFNVTIWDTNDRTVYQNQSATADDLENVVGKEIAQKMVDGYYDTLGDSPGNNLKYIEGNGLKVGGEGMRQFYDRIVPQVANDVLKKMGGSKVEHIKIPANDRMLRMAGDKDAGYWLAYGDTGATFDSRRFKTREEADAALSETRTGIPVFGFTFTDALLKTIRTKGMPLFSRAIKSISGYNIIENPTRDQAENLLSRSRYKSMRGLRDPDTGKLYIWDASEDIHHRVARELGIFDDVYERLEFDDVGTLPEGVFAGEAGYGRVIADRPGAYEVRFSRRAITGDSGRKYTPEQQAMHKHVGRDVEQLTAAEKLKRWAGQKWIQGLFDQFEPIKRIDKHAYTLMRLSKGASGAFEALMRHGKLSIKDGAYDADTSGGVLEKVFFPLGKESTDFLYWVAGNRAERLMKEDREHLFTPEDIAAAKSLADGQTDFDYTLSNGKTTRDRAAIYRDSLTQFTAFNKNVLDMAEQSGLIDGESRQYWEHEFYVPFYRVDEDADVTGGGIKQGVVRQKAFQKLKGGTDGLNDLMANTLANWAHLIDASVKNRAAKEAVESAAKMGVARPAVAGEKKTVWFMDGGVKQSYAVEDSAVMQALEGLSYAGLRGPMMDALSRTKHWLTIGVTASPFFKVRNLIRDSVQSVAVSPLSYNIGKNLKKGFQLTGRENQEYVSALAGGGLIRFGTMLEGNEASRTRQLIKKGAKDAHILDDENKLRAFYDKWLEPSIAAYNELGNRGEEINRMALFDQLKKQGVDHATASLMARDLMDFSLQGTFVSVRFLAQAVPFFNARLQGLYKLGRGAKDDRAKMATVVGMTALASLALLAAYHDDDDWKKREDWDRDNYWWFKFGGIAFRIPKPFEIGAIATLAERSAELLFDQEMTGKRFKDATLTLLSNQLAMNPVPQLVKPIMDVYANKDSFTGRPIETMGMERLEPAYRYTGNTSMLARGMSTATGGFYSPVQVDHLLRAYFAWLGAFIVGGTDIVVRGLSNEPTRPAVDAFKFSTGGMVAQLDSASSRYVSQMYDQAKELEQAYGTYRHLLKQGRREEAVEYMQDNAESLKHYRRTERIKQAMSKQNQAIRKIESSDMDADEKRERILRIKRLQDQMARMAVQ